MQVPIDHSRVILEYGGYRVVEDLLVDSVELQLQSTSVLHDEVHVGRLIGEHGYANDGHTRVQSVQNSH